MAAYAELLTASENETLLKKVRVGCVIAAEKVRVEAPATTNHANRLLWARDVYISPESVATRMLWAMLAQTQVATPAVTLAQLTGATDAAVQSAVDASVDVFATGVAG